MFCIYSMELIADFSNLWCKVIFSIRLSIFKAIKSHQVMRNKWCWKFIYMKPSDISVFFWFDIFWHILPIRYDRKIIHLHSLYSTNLHKNLLIYIFRIHCYANLFQGLSYSTFSEKFTIFYFATRKRPESGPCIQSKCSTNEQYV